MSRPAPYAFDDVPRYERAQALGLHALARLGAPRLPEAVAQTCSTLLGAGLSVEAAGPAASASQAELGALRRTRVLVALELHHVTPPARALVALPHELCAVLVDRVLGGEGNVVQAPNAALDPMSIGVLGYLAARMAAATDGAVRVTGISPAGTAIDFGDATLVWPARVALTGSPIAFAHVVLSAADAASLRVVSDRRAAAERIERAQQLGGCRIELCVHAGEVTLLASELASLQLGDVVFPEQHALEPTQDGYCGEVELHALGNRRTPLARCSLRIDTLTITHLSNDESQESHPMTEGHKHPSTAKPTQASLAAPLGDAPLELCLELARFSLRLDELLSLREGELLSTGKPVGSEVTLAAAGRAVARGELIVLDGELGLRITTLLKVEP